MFIPKSINKIELKENLLVIDSKELNYGNLTEDDKEVLNTMISKGSKYLPLLYLNNKYMLESVNGKKLNKVEYLTYLLECKRIKKAGVKESSTKLRPLTNVGNLEILEGDKSIYFGKEGKLFEEAEELPDSIYGALYNAFKNSDNKTEQRIFRLLDREEVGPIIVDKDSKVWWFDGGKGAPDYAHNYIEKYIKNRWGLDWLYTKFPVPEKNIKEAALTDLEKEVLKSWGYPETDFRQIGDAIDVTEYTLIDKDEKKRKISAKQARKILGDVEFLSGISRSAFHYTAMRDKDGLGVYFDSSKLFESFDAKEFYKYRICNDDDLIVIRKNGEVIAKGMVDNLKDNWDRFDGFVFDEAKKKYFWEYNGDVFTIEKIIVEDLKEGYKQGYMGKDFAELEDMYLKEQITAEELAEELLKMYETKEGAEEAFEMITEYPMSSLNKAVKESARDIREVSPEEMNAFLDKWELDPKDKTIYGDRIYYKGDNSIVALDNTTGDAWVEEFGLDDEEAAKSWLNGEIEYEDYKKGLKESEESGEVISKDCPMCDKMFYMSLNKDEADRYLSYLNGDKLIQDLFPELNVVEREFLKTGYCPECQELLFSSNVKSDRVKEVMNEDAGTQVGDIAPKEDYIEPMVKVSTKKKNIKESEEENFKDMVMELHSYVEADPERISSDLQNAIKNNKLDDYLKSKAAMSDEEVKDFKERYLKESIEAYTDEEKVECGLDDEGYDKNGDLWIHCAWCGELVPESDCKKELNMGWICKGCQNTLYSRGEKAHYEEGANYLEESLKEDAANITDIEYVEPNYTGGGVYVYTGKLKDGNYFLGGDDWFSDETPYFTIRVVDTNPDMCEDDECWFDDWQQEHLVRDLTEKENKEITKQILHWIIENKPDGNYDIRNMEDMLDIVEPKKIEEAVNNSKQRFIDYCKGKIKDLDAVKIKGKDIEDISFLDVEENKIYKIRVDYISNDNVKVLNSEDTYDAFELENTYLYPDGRIFDGGEMDAGHLGHLAELDFKVIDKSFYQEVLDNWDSWELPSWFEVADEHKNKVL